ncbi:hypothetical protein D3C71_2080070 [compost metagenome]
MGCAEGEDCARLALRAWVAPGWRRIAADSAMVVLFFRDGSVRKVVVAGVGNGLIVARVWLIGKR